MNRGEKVPENIIISRTDSIGDVILTLPLAKILKARFPNIKIAFLGKNYTRPIIESCAYVDQFIDLNHFLEGEVQIGGCTPAAILHVFPKKEIAIRAKTLGIPLRIGTTNRLYHWSTCNKLVRLSRKKSSLHEAQLNTRLLKPLGINRNFTLEELGDSVGMTRIQTLPATCLALIDPSKFNLILHATSQGSAREWGLENFSSLIRLLPQKDYKIFISGTVKERDLLAPLFNSVGSMVTDICGTMDLGTFISFINSCDGLVANSTGPLHIAAALRKVAIGIYPNIRPMHPGRWRPLGLNADFVAIESLDLQLIPPAAIYEKLEEARNFRKK